MVQPTPSHQRSFLSKQTSTFEWTLSDQLNELRNSANPDISIMNAFNSSLKACNDSLPPLCDHNASISDKLDVVAMYIRIISGGLKSKRQTVVCGAELGRAAFHMVSIWAETVSISEDAYRRNRNRHMDDHVLQIAVAFPYHRGQKAEDEAALRYLRGAKEVLSRIQNITRKGPVQEHGLVRDKLAEMKEIHEAITAIAMQYDQRHPIAMPSPPDTPRGDSIRPSTDEMLAPAPMGTPTATSVLDAVTPLASSPTASPHDMERDSWRPLHSPTYRVAPERREVIDLTSWDSEDEAEEIVWSSDGSTAKPRPQKYVVSDDSESEAEVDELESDSGAKNLSVPAWQLLVKTEEEVPLWKLRFQTGCDLAKECPFREVQDRKQFWNWILKELKASGLWFGLKWSGVNAMREFFRDNWEDFVRAVPQVGDYKPHPPRRRKRKQSETTNPKEPVLRVAPLSTINLNAVDPSLRRLSRHSAGPGAPNAQSAPKTPGKITPPPVQVERSDVASAGSAPSGRTGRPTWQTAPRSKEPTSSSSSSSTLKRKRSASLAPRIPKRKAQNGLPQFREVAFKAIRSPFV